MTKSRLSWTIKAAFKDVTYPGDDRIGDPEGRDDAESLTEALRGKTWQSLLEEDERGFGPLSLYFMTAEAAHYYLPAYMLRALDCLDAHAIIIRLTPYEGPHPYPKQIFSQFIGLLTPEQRQALYDLFIYLYNETPTYFRAKQEMCIRLEGRGKLSNSRLRRIQEDCTQYIEDSQRQLEPVIPFLHSLLELKQERLFATNDTSYTFYVENGEKRIMRLNLPLSPQPD